MCIHVDDSKLPALSTLDKSALSQITGNSQTQLLRFRYQPGRRAVLHVASRNGEKAQEGAIWFFAGNKAKRIAGLHPTSRYHEPTGALYECFPWDHRLHEISAFLDEPDTVLGNLTGGKLTHQPELLRYRPGISATFRCTAKNQPDCYIKIIAKLNLDMVAANNLRITKLLQNSHVAIARVLCVDSDRRIIVYEPAVGTTLENILMSATDTKTVIDTAERVVAALSHLSSLSGIKSRLLGRDELISRAENACRLITLNNDESAAIAQSILMRMRTTKVHHREQLIHGDMKLEHAFMSENRVTFIDTESLAIGDLNYDLAKLDARVVSAFVQGHIRKKTMDAMVTVIHDAATSDYGWFRNAAILQTAKYFAQRPGQKNSKLCRKLMQMAT